MGRRTILPLLGGEGRGEGEPKHHLIYSHLRRNAQSIRDTIFNELQAVPASFAGPHAADEPG